METVVRICVIYLALLVGMRVIGKREFSQLSAHEFVVLLVIPEIVSTSLNMNDTSLTNALLGVATIFTLVFLTSVLTQKNKLAEKLISDTAAVLVHRGRIYEDILNKERVTSEEIMTEARKSGVERLEQIRWAILEPDGKISIIQEEGESQPNKDEDAPAR